MNSNRPGLTLIEVIVCVALLGIVGVAATGMQAHLGEEARTAKCLSNLKRQIVAIHQYAAEHDGVLPGPVHPAIKRHLHDIGGFNPEADRRKSLTWLLRPYFPAVGDSATNPATANPIVDEVFRCPTANMITPDQPFLEYDTGSCWEERPYNYVCNTWGPIGSQGSMFDRNTASWQSTDPPHYFGAWFFCDSTPVASRVCWKPKRLDAIPNAAAEWATADAWFRRVFQGGSRAPDPRRGMQGTYAPKLASFLAPIPSAPYHGVPPREARSHRDWGVEILPTIDFDGETNQAYFDGHVAAFKGNWRELGDGGSINPYWELHGGTHPFTEPWDAEVCNQAAP